MAQKGRPKSINKQETKQEAKPMEKSFLENASIEVNDLVTERELQLEKELENKEQQYNALSNEVQGLKEMLKMFMSANMGQQSQQSSTNSMMDNRVVIGSNIMGNETLMPNKYREITVEGFKEKVTISIEDANMIMGKVKYRKLFQDGLFYFDDPKWYQYFNINTEVILNDEGIIEVLMLPEKEMIEKFNKITERKTNEIALHSLVVRIAHLLKNNKANIGFDKMPVLEEYFKAKLGSMMVLIELIK